MGEMGKAMNNNDTELFELCKKVYELTGWETDDWFTNAAEDEMSLAEMPDIPLYTSDYLLEKLPGQFGNRGSSSVQCLRLCKSNEGYMAGYIGVDLVWWLESVDDNPLKALLKLTIALHEAGVKL